MDLRARAQDQPPPPPRWQCAGYNSKSQLHQARLGPRRTQPHSTTAAAAAAAAARFQQQQKIKYALQPTAGAAPLGPSCPPPHQSARPVSPAPSLMPALPPASLCRGPPAHTQGEGADLVVDPLAIVTATVVVRVDAGAVALAVHPVALRCPTPGGQSSVATGAATGAVAKLGGLGGLRADQRRGAGRGAGCVGAGARARGRGERGSSGCRGERDAGVFGGIGIGILLTSKTSLLAYCRRPRPCICPLSICPEYIAAAVLRSRGSGTGGQGQRRRGSQVSGRDAEGRRPAASRRVPVGENSDEISGCVRNGGAGSEKARRAGTARARAASGPPCSPHSPPCQETRCTRRWARGMWRRGLHTPERPATNEKHERLGCWAVGRAKFSDGNQKSHQRCVQSSPLYKLKYIKLFVRRPHL